MECLKGNKMKYIEEELNGTINVFEKIIMKEKKYSKCFNRELDAFLTFVINRTILQYVIIL